ncbi:MAG TPA: hypothetical protein VHB21_27485 [Minicystis sp.]|nr:hypothetical protein [Minicystis sp.]
MARSKTRRTTTDTSLGAGPSALVFLAALAASTQAACVVAQRDVLVRVRDPAEVTLASASPGSGGRVVWHRPLGEGPTHDVVVAAGTFAEDGVRSTSYELRADRRDDGGIVLRWTHPAIGGGDIQTLLTPEGRIRLPATDDARGIVPSGPLPPELSVPCASWLAEETDSDGGFTGYGAYFGARRAPAIGFAKVVVPLSLETPWSNVVEVRRRVSPRRTGAIVGAIATTAGGALLSTMLFALASNADDPSSHGGADVLHAIGGTFIGTGVVVDLLLLPTIVASSEDERVYPRR